MYKLLILLSFLCGCAALKPGTNISLGFVGSGLVATGITATYANESRDNDAMIAAGILASTTIAFMGVAALVYLAEEADYETNLGH